MPQTRSIDEAYAFQPLLTELQYRSLWCIEQLRREAVHAGQNGRLLDLLCDVAQREPLHVPAEWVHLLRARAERAGATRLAQLAGHYEHLLENVESMLRGRSDAPDRIARSSSLLELLERRCSERAPVQLDVTLTLPDRQLSARCHNLSEGGMLLELERPLVVGTIGSVLLPIEPPLGPVEARARVVWTSDASPERPLLGAEFVQTPREARNRIGLFVRRLTQAQPK